MKELINYYYNFDISGELNEFDNYIMFKYNNDNFYFVLFNRDIKELNDLVSVCNELYNKNIKVHSFIYNKNNELLTKVNDKNYILLKLNINSNENINFFDVYELLDKLKLNNNNSLLYRNNWAELWSKKIDYFEYQIKEIGYNKKLILDSFNYYVGLAENAISYVNKINKVIGISENDHITLSHRKIFYPNIALNYFNPLSFIFDLEIRDIAEYLKAEFFKDENSLNDLKSYLKIKKLSSYSYHMLYARLIYPSYYFYLYESIMDNNYEENSLMKYINKIDDYELFLKDAYLEISKYTNLEHIDWLLKK